MEQRRRWLEGLEKPKEEDEVCAPWEFFTARLANVNTGETKRHLSVKCSLPEEVEVPSGTAPVFPAAAESQDVGVESYKL